MDLKSEDGPFNAKKRQEISSAVIVFAAQETAVIRMAMEPTMQELGVRKQRTEKEALIAAAREEYVQEYLDEP